MKKISNNFLVKILAVFFIVVLIVLFFRSIDTNKPNLEKLSSKIISFCAQENSRQTCYDREIPKILSQGVTLEESFDVIKLIQNQDNGYWFCHAVAHKLSTEEYYKNPNKWKEIMTRIPVGICSNGGLHGALQAHFSSEALNGVQINELMPDLQMICEKRENWQPTAQQQSSCYHELGHLSMYITNADILSAADICDTVGVKDDGRNYLQTCHEGIFMQVFEPREPDDFALIYNIVPQKEKLTVCEKYTEGIDKGACWKIGWKEKYEEFCNKFSGDLRFACFREAWLINDKQIQTAEGIVKYCSYSDDNGEKRKCYNKLFYSLMSIFDFDIERMKPICVSLPKILESQCFANIASRLIETDKRLIEKSVDVCKYAAHLGMAEECYNELVHYANFVFLPGSEDFNKLCRILPDTWLEKCLVLKN